MSIPILKLVCQQCGREFPVSPSYFARLGFEYLPKRCPTCNDIKQRRPSIIQERELIAVYDGVEIVALPPAEWQEVEGNKGGIPAYKLTVKGSKYGAAWNGRIDIFSNFIPKIGDVVSIREMQSKHLVKVKYETKKTVYGTITVEREVPVTTDDPEAEEVVRTHKYLVIEPYDGEATCRMVWAEARTKTTLKGFGRQYWSEVGGAPITKWEVEGGYRSGRAHTTGVLAIVDEEHPLYITTTGDIQDERVYS